MEKLFIPILVDTTRPKRESVKPARLIEQVGKTIDEIEVLLVDPNDYHFPFDGNDEENKDPRYTELTAKADGFFIVTPEYNHSYPGTLKRMLDSELKNYIHKPVAFAGVSSGVFAVCGRLNHDCIRLVRWHGTDICRFIFSKSAGIV